jgi:hypothetical protein
VSEFNPLRFNGGFVGCSRAPGFKAAFPKNEVLGKPHEVFEIKYSNLQTKQEAQFGLICTEQNKIT